MYCVQLLLVVAIATPYCYCVAIDESTTNGNVTVKFFNCFYDHFVLRCPET